MASIRKRREPAPSVQRTVKARAGTPDASDTVGARPLREEVGDMRSSRVSPAKELRPMHPCAGRLQRTTDAGEHA